MGTYLGRAGTPGRLFMEELLPKTLRNFKFSSEILKKSTAEGTEPQMPLSARCGFR